MDLNKNERFIDFFWLLYRNTHDTSSISSEEVSESFEEFSDTQSVWSQSNAEIQTNSPIKEKKIRGELKLTSTL
jgi:hypothetical protein